MDSSSLHHSFNSNNSHHVSLGYRIQTNHFSTRPLLSFTHTTLFILCVCFYPAKMYSGWRHTHTEEGGQTPILSSPPFLSLACLPSFLLPGCQTGNTGRRACCYPCWWSSDYYDTALICDIKLYYLLPHRWFDSHDGRVGGNFLVVVGGTYTRDQEGAHLVNESEPLELGNLCEWV